MKEKFADFSVNERIMLIMREKNLNKNSFSKTLDLTQPALKKIEDKENLPSFKLLFQLLKQIPELSPEWLITGNGNMYREPEEEHPSYSALVETNKNLSETVKNLSEAVNHLSSKKDSNQ